jgi:hypothetical protein
MHDRPSVADQESLHRRLPDLTVEVVAEVMGIRVKCPIARWRMDDLGVLVERSGAI